MDCEASMEHLLERMVLDPSAEPTNLPLSLLKAITNDFSDHMKIGSGGFAHVYKGELQNGSVIAVKKLLNCFDMDEEKFIREVGCLMKAKHKNIVRFLGYCSDTQGKILNHEGKMIQAEERQRLLCFEFVSNGSLDKYITDVSKGLEWRMRYKIIKGICEGLHYLHQDIHIVHSDLKPANILLDENMVPKIADFGLARCFDGKQSRTIASKVIGTLGYMAPETYDGFITFKSDIYSIGIVIMEILTGWKGYCDIQNILQSWSTRFELSQEDIWLQHVEVCAEIGKKCIDHNPTDRPDTFFVIQKLDEVQRMSGCIESDISTSSATQDKMVSGNLVEIVHTIGDEASSFTKFIMDLRQKLAAHQDREVIFELCPQLAKQQAEQPTRWIKVKLQVLEGDEMSSNSSQKNEMSSTTLLMRDDNLYVCGFINQYGILCKLVENKDSESFLPGGLFHPTTDLQLGVSYSSLLQAKNRDDVVRKLTAAQLSSAFTKDAVRVLSSHPDKVAGINMSIGVALAGLIFIVCESARMTSVHKSIEAGWSNGKGFTEELMGDVWNYGGMSRSLQEWKSRNYTAPHCVSELQATHLVLNSLSYKLYDDYYYTTRPLVELLAISADLGVVGTKIIVFDGKRGQIIYRKEEQGDQGRMEDLVLTGPYRGILARYGCFAIRIDIPATSPIIWKWDCYDREYAAQVNGPPVSHIICNPHDNREVAKVTYAVMSRAKEATVQVKLRLNNGHSPGDISGEIVAFVHGFDFPIVLFNCAQQRTSQFFSPTDDSWILLPLARNVVAVPYRKILCIQVDLQNEISKKLFKDDVYIPVGIRSRRHVVDGCEIDVNVSWYPEVNFVLRPWDYPELVYTIGDDEMSYTRFIMEVRRIVTDHPEGDNDILDGHPDPNRRSTRQHPMLSMKKRWLHVKLQVAGEGESTIRIAIRCDDMTIHGFNNQNNDYWYSTTDESLDNSVDRLEKLNWGYRYDDILQVRTEDWGKVMDKLNSESLGKTSAVNAVCVLSRFSNWPYGEADEARLAMVRLMVMISDSARMNPVHHAIAGGWNNGTEITKQLMDYIRYWDRITTALVDWKESSYSRWEKDDKLQGIGIEKEEHALEVVHLCSTVRIIRSLSQWQMGPDKRR